MWKIDSVKHFLFTLTLFVSSLAFSQEVWEKEDNTVELEDVQVEIVKDREIILPKATRGFEKIPPLPVVKKETTLTYDFKNFNFQVPSLEFKLRPLKTKPQPISKLYNGYVKVGFGNYITPYAEGFFSNKRDKRYNYGIRLKHLSSKNGPVDDDNSGVGESMAEVYGRLFARKLTLGTGVQYSNRQNHFYGYNNGTVVEANDIAHDFNEFRFNAIAKSNDTPVSYKLNFDYFYINDNKYLTENEVRFQLNTEFEVGKKSDMNIDAGLNYINQNDSLFSGHNRLLASIQPKYNFKASDVNLSVGINLTYVDDTLGKLSKFRVYPLLNANYSVNKTIDVNAYFKGSTSVSNYRELSSDNAFIQANNTVHFANNLYTLGLNVDAQINSNASINVGIDYGSYKNSLFFMNDVNEPEQFILVYDTGSISLANFYGSVSYSNGSTIQLSARGDYYSYTMDALQEAWHRPQYKIEVRGIFDLYKKVIVTTDLSFLGGIIALDVTNSTIELNPIIDFNLKAEYLFTDRFSVFIQLKNIFGQTYQLYNRYPVKGFQIIGGVSYSF